MNHAADMTLILASLVLIIVVARAAGWLFTQIGQPAVVGEIAAGVLLGPSLLGDSVSEFLFPMDQRAFLVLLANVGLVLFMFIVGLELDVGLVRGHGRVAGAVSIGSITLPFSLGVGVAFLLADEHAVDGEFWPFALFLGAAMSVTAFPVLARILTDRGLHRTQTGGLALACAAVDDVLAWTLLAVVIGFAGGSEPGDGPAWLIVLAVPFAVLMLMVVRPRLGALVQLHERLGRLTPGLLAVVLVGLLLSSAATEALHVHFIFGAFLFGAVMPRAGGTRLRHEILVRLEQISVVLLLPVFFLVSGLNVDIGDLSASQLLQLLLILAVAVAGKAVGAYVGARLTGVPRWQARSLGVLMNTRGLTELVILNVGREKGLIGEDLFTMLVIMALVTTMMTGPLLRRTYPDSRVARDIAEAERLAMGADAAPLVALVVAADETRSAARFDLAVVMAAGTRPVDIAISSLEPFRATRLEVGSGLTDELVSLTDSMAATEGLARRGEALGIRVDALSRFSSDIGADVVAQVEAMGPQWVIVGQGDPAHPALVERCRRRLVVVDDGPALTMRAGTVHVVWANGRDGDLALLLGIALARSWQVPCTVGLATGGPERRLRVVLERLSRRGVDLERVDESVASALQVGPLGTSGCALSVRAEEQAEEIDWAGVDLLVAPVDAPA